MTSKRSITVTKRGQHLVPADPYSAEIIDGLPSGRPLNAVISETWRDSRRAGQLRLWWAGVGLLADNIDSDKWPTKTKLSDAILLEIGHSEQLWRLDGSYRIQPLSISPDNLPDEDFEALFERAREMCERVFSFDPWKAWQDEKSARMKEATI